MIVIETALGVFIGGLALYFALSRRRAIQQTVERAQINAARLTDKAARVNAAQLTDKPLSWLRARQRGLAIVLSWALFASIVQGGLWWRAHHIVHRASGFEIPQLDLWDSLAEKVPVAMRSLNTAGLITSSVFLSEAHFGEKLPPYDPFEGIEGTIFEAFPEELVTVLTPADREAVRIRLEDKIRDAHTLVRGGSDVLAGWFIACILDPLLWIAGALGLAVARRPLAAVGSAATALVLAYLIVGASA